MNIQSIKIVSTNRISGTYNSPISIPDEMQDIKDEGMRRRNIHPNLETIYNKY